MIQTNNVEVDDRGYIYVVDRANSGLHILELNGSAREVANLPRSALSGGTARLSPLLERSQFAEGLCSRGGQSGHLSITVRNEAACPARVAGPDHGEFA